MKLKLVRDEAAGLVTAAPYDGTIFVIALAMPVAKTLGCLLARGPVNDLAHVVSKAEGIADALFAKGDAGALVGNSAANTKKVLSRQAILTDNVARDDHCLVLPDRERKMSSENQSYI